MNNEVLAAYYVQVEKHLNPLCTAANAMSIAFQFCQNTSFLKVTVECNSAKLVDLLKSDIICSIEVAWIPEDITLLKDIFAFIPFVSIPLQCNHATLALASAAKEKEDIVWLEEFPSFLLPTVQHDSI